MQMSPEEISRLNQFINSMKTARLPFWQLWRELANFYLPKRYVWLQSSNEQRIMQSKNPYILDSTGTNAARILASGMMNGITSPSRQWFKLRVPGFFDEGSPITLWTDEVARRMLMIMAESNFYNSLALLYLDLVVFGTGASLIYEDDESVIRCYNPALGEYYLGQDHRLRVNTFAREFKQTPRQLVQWFGEENVSESVKSAAKSNNGTGQQVSNQTNVRHLVEPNIGETTVSKVFPYRETYYEEGAPEGKILGQRGFHEMPGIFPRWELTANDCYGTSPGMDALADVIQLQQETKRKAQGLDKMVNPPIVADVQLQHRPTALMPNGITYVAGANNIGAKPLYQITAPIQDMTTDIRDVQQRIREIFHNPLFNMISQLDTVRSATEIDARREEKLVLLGSVLERFQNEALNPAINRIFSIMQRRKLLPPPPPELNGVDLEIQYVSILQTAQSAVAAAPVERWVGLIGNVAGVVPSVANVPNWDELIRNYGISIGVEARDMHTREEVAQIEQEQQKQQEQQQQAAIAEQLAKGAQTLSQTDVGGGANALQALMG